MTRYTDPSECPVCGLDFADRHNPACTGRAGCVRQATDPAPVTAPTTETGPASGKATGIVEPLLVLAEGFYAETHDMIVAAHDEITRLRDEVERLGEECNVQMAAAWANEVRQEDRAALAQRVAEAVREACMDDIQSLLADSDWWELEDLWRRLRAIDLAPIVAEGLATPTENGCGNG
jgi:hypothetical protein